MHPKTCIKNKSYKNGKTNNKKLKQKNSDNPGIPKEPFQSWISKPNKEFAKEKKNSWLKKCKNSCAKSTNRRKGFK